MKFEKGYIASSCEKGTRVAEKCGGGNIILYVGVSNMTKCDDVGLDGSQQIVQKRDLFYEWPPRAKVLEIRNLYNILTNDYYCRRRTLYIKHYR